MTGRRQLKARVDRAAERREAAPSLADEEAGSTPHQRLLHAARTGRLEAFVRAARPAQPPAMVTPEEREAELRADGRWPDDQSSASPVTRGRPGGGEPQTRPEASPRPDPPPSDGGGGPEERELTPSEQYIAEHCHWRLRGPNDYVLRRPENQCITEYDPFTGALIGDGYRHDEDDEW